MKLTPTGQLATVAAKIDRPTTGEIARDCRAGPCGRAAERARIQPARRQAPALQSVRPAAPLTAVARLIARCCAFLALCGPLSVTTARATTTPAPANTAVTSVAELSWLAGRWRGTTPAGRTIDTTYTTPEGGVLLGTSKEYTPDGRCAFFDLEHFAMKDGVLTLTPHPAGKRSAHSFALASFDRTARRATFVNREHDWPQQFVYERVADDRLVITLSGPGKNGNEHVERFELQLAR